MDPSSGARSIVVHVEGMTCSSCVQTIEQRIGKLNGIHVIKVSLDEKSATIVYNPKEQIPESLQEAIEDMGFGAVLGDTDPQSVPHDTTFLTIPTQATLTCEQIRTDLLKVKGILDVKISSDKTTLVVTFISSILTSKQVNQIVPGLNLDNALQDKNQGTCEDVNLNQINDVVLRLKIEGMTCHSCTSTIEGKIGKLQGIKRIKVSLDNQEAMVTYQPHLITSEEIRKQIEAAGFIASEKKMPKPLQLGSIDIERLKSSHTRRSEGAPQESLEGKPEGKTVAFRVDGMHCNSCVFNIQSSLLALPSVSSITVSLQEKSAVVQYNPGLISLGALRRAIEAVSPGTFKACILDAHEKAEQLSNSRSPPKLPLPTAVHSIGLRPLTLVTVHPHRRDDLPLVRAVD
ncbi:hypothetical protein E2320_012844 [Naja naja]|nr:hypothetical protein E2320_012844 [Naja naja]